MNFNNEPRSTHWIDDSRKTHIPQREEGAFLWPSERPTKPVKVSPSHPRTHHRRRRR